MLGPPLPSLRSFTLWLWLSLHDLAELLDSFVTVARTFGALDLHRDFLVSSLLHLSSVPFTDFFHSTLVRFFHWVLIVFVLWLCPAPRLRLPLCMLLAQPLFLGIGQCVRRSRCQLVFSWIGQGVRRSQSAGDSRDRSACMAL